MTLRDKMAKETAKMAPSMIPSTPAPPPKKSVEIIPDFQTAVKERRDRLDLARMTLEYKALSADIDKKEKSKKDISTKLKDILGRNSLDTLQVNEYKLKYFNVPRSTIKADRLLAAGVQESVIVAATVTTDSYQLRVTPLKGDE